MPSNKLIESQYNHMHSSAPFVSALGLKRSVAAGTNYFRFRKKLALYTTRSFLKSHFSLSQQGTAHLLQNPKLNPTPS
jgi:hypothetical protein